MRFAATVSFLHTLRCLDESPLGHQCGLTNLIFIIFTDSYNQYRVEIRPIGTFFAVEGVKV
jgi:hypothetical protein